MMRGRSIVRYSESEEKLILIRCSNKDFGNLQSKTLDAGTSMSSEIRITHPFGQVERQHSKQDRGALLELLTQRRVHTELCHQSLPLSLFPCSSPRHNLNPAGQTSPLYLSLRSPC